MGCIASLCEPPDDWTFMDDARPDEQGAGMLYKKGRNRGTWNQRFFVIQNGSFLYYQNASRTKIKGVVKLFNASVKIPGSSSSGGNKWYFQVAHTIYGVRDFYATSERRRDQWMLALQNEVDRLRTVGYWEGALLKRGGYSGKQWQQRWCIVHQRLISYYENPEDDFPKGSIELTGGKFRETSISDQQYCVEIIARSSTSGKVLKRVFALETFMDRQQLLAVLNEQAKSGRNSLRRAFGLPTGDSESKGEGGGDDEDEDEGVELGVQDKSLLRQGYRSSDSGVKTGSAETHKAGYVMKKSPRIMGGWQKRFLLLLDDGTLSYYSSEYDVARKPPKGRVALSDLLPESPCLVSGTGGGFSVSVPGRIYEFMCDTTAMATDWVNNIKAVAETLGLEED